MSRLVAGLFCVFAVVLPAAAGTGGVEFYAADVKWVLLAAPGSSAVQVLDVSRGVTPLATLRSTRRGKVLAVHVQRASRRVWVLADSGLDVHDGFNGRLLGHWAAPEGVRLERLETNGAGGLEVWGGARPYEALVGAAVLVPAAARVTMR
jgi:hypothetical protein